MDSIEKNDSYLCKDKKIKFDELRTNFHDSFIDKKKELITLAEKVRQIVNNHDIQQVSEQLKNIDRRFDELSERLRRKYQIFEITCHEIDSIENEINLLTNKLVEQYREKIENNKNYGYSSQELKDRIKIYEKFLRENDLKNNSKSNLRKRIENIRNDVEEFEVKHLENQLNKYERKSIEIFKKTQIDLQKLLEAIEICYQFENELKDIQSYLETKSNEIFQEFPNIPLKSDDILQQINHLKFYENSFIKFQNTNLDNFEKKCQFLSTECNENNKIELKNLSDSIKSDYLKMVDDLNNLLKNFDKLYENRKNFEKKFDYITNLIKDAEQFAKFEMIHYDVNILNEKLELYKNLKIQNQEIDNDINQLIDNSKTFMNNLKVTDQILLHDQINGLENRNNNLSKLFDNHISLIENFQKELQILNEKFDEISKFVEVTKSELNSLNKPINENLTDVETLLNTYEALFLETNNKKLIFNDLFSHNKSNNYNSLATDLNTLSNVIENEIIKVKAWYLLREQYYSIKTDLIDSLDQFEETFRNINQLKISAEEKIQKYDNFGVKIQELYALLASLVDKTQEISNTCSILDFNKLSEDNQQLNVRLNNFQKNIEINRKDYEMIAEEHEKILNEINEIFDWFNENNHKIHSKPLLNQTIASVTKEMDLYVNLKSNIDQQLNHVTTIVTNLENDENLPIFLFEKLSDLRSLMTSIPQIMFEQQEYLNINKQLRIDYDNIITELQLWFEKANVILDRNQNGFCLKTIQQHFEDHQLYFKDVSQIRDTFSEKLQHSINNMWASLSKVHQEDLICEQNEFFRKFDSIQNLEKSQKSSISETIDLWNEWKLILDKIQITINRNQLIDVSVESLINLQFHIQHVQDSLQDLQVCIFVKLQ